MPGGLMQLIAYGAENLYLTGNPQITFFKTVYRRHTNFAMEYIDQYFVSLPSFSEDEETISTIKIERNADLIYDCYLVYDLPDIYSDDLFKFKWVNNVGLRIINYIEIFVDGQLLDKQYGQWMYIWNELTLSLSKRPAYNRLIGNIDALTDPKFSHGFYNGVNSVPSIPSTRLMIPLEFWFCKNPGLAIPLIALQYNEITINVHFNGLNDLFLIEHQGITYSPKNKLDLVNDINTNITDGNYTAAEEVVATAYLDTLNNSSLIWYYINGSSTAGIWTENTFILANYIYLDDDERRKFALSSHEYLMTQTTRFENGGLKGTNNVIEYKYQHPVKEYVWVFQRDDFINNNDWTNFTNQARGQKYDTVDYDTYKGLHSTVETFKTFSEINSGSTTDLKIFDNHIDIMYNCKFIMNGKDRFSTQPSVFFNSLVPYKYDTNSPVDGIYSYTFALYPEKMQPSGNCNFSRINKFQVNFDLRHSRDSVSNLDHNYNLFMYGVNFNIFRIISGIGGVAFN